MTTRESENAGSRPGVPTLEVRVDVRDAGRLVQVVPSGAVCMATSALLYRELELLLSRTDLRRIDIDLGSVATADSSAIATLSAFARRCEQRDVELGISNLPGELRQIAGMMPRETELPAVRPKDRNPFEWLGQYAMNGWQRIGDFYDTLTNTAFAAARVFTGQLPPRGSVTTQSVRIGVDALPIVALLSLLLGLVLAFQAADQLKAFGAAIYTADLVGVGMFREFGPILTGIVLAGRSGSSIAAELGTMQVNEEIDALRTMGIDPDRYLTLPRLVGIAIAQPALTLMSNLIGAFGGFLIGTLYLKIPGGAYWNQSLTAIEASDLFQGLAKSLIFAGLIGIIACYSGFSVRGGAGGVGRATTRAVVASIFMIIVADSIFTTLVTLSG